MLDLRTVRGDPDRVKVALARRGEVFGPMVDDLLVHDEERRAAVSKVDDLKAERNEVSREIGESKKRGDDASESVVRMREVGGRIAELDATVARIDERIREILLMIPNLPLDEVPEGGEEANHVAGSWVSPEASRLSRVPTGKSGKPWES